MLIQSELKTLESDTLNPIKAGGSESMYSLEKKALENRHRIEMHVNSPIF